jgi:hypothetical protein
LIVFPVTSAATLEGAKSPATTVIDTGDALVGDPGTKLMGGNPGAVQMPTVPDWPCANDEPTIVRMSVASRRKDFMVVFGKNSLQFTMVTFFGHRDTDLAGGSAIVAPNLATDRRWRAAERRRDSAARATFH